MRCFAANTAAQSSQRLAMASDGICQLLRGERLISVAAAPSGVQERLNCCWKNLRKKIFSVFSIVSALYEPLNASFANAAIFSGSELFLIKCQIKKSCSS